MTLWMTVVGAAFVTAAPFVRGAKRITSGWALSRPIPEGVAFRGKAIEYLVLGVAIVLAAALAASANLIVTIVKLRAPGLTARRMPLFSWSVLVSGAVMLLALPVLIAGMGMLFVDHHYGAQIFGGYTGSRGGNPQMWTRIFWFGAYPMLWALVLPVFGLASEVIPVFARRPIADRAKAMGAIAAVGILAFFGWGSEVTNMPRSRLFFAAGALVVLAPAASVLVNWLLTLREAVKERGTAELREGLMSTPMMYVAGILSVLVAGLAASAVSAVAAGRGYHTDYWQVGQQHLMYFAPATLAIAAAAHFWGPKVWGRHLSPTIGKLEVLLLTGGAHLAFLPALVLGLQNMPVETSTYTASDNWRVANVVMSIGAGIFALGALVFVVNMVVSVALRKGRPAAADPWSGHTLEWTVPTPLPRYNFDRLPEVRSATPALDLHASGVDE
jgi:cytochrome c oxidase subunit 1